jgi:hypothetical protein
MLLEMELDTRARGIQRLNRHTSALEPMVYGHSAGLSPVAVVVSATFWTALWGPVGLVLATPLTICLVVLGRHVERLAFLDVMFGDRPALSPPEIFYQRMLAADPAEAVDHAEEFLKEKPLSAYYDEVALKLGQNDVARGSLDDSHMEKIRAAVSELLDDLAEQEDRTPARGRTQDSEAAAAVATVEDTVSGDLPVLAKEDLAPAWQAEMPVLCAAVRSPLDTMAAMMLAQLLGKHGLGARVEGANALSSSNISGLETRGIALVCLSTLDSSTPAHIRYTIRRVRRRFPDAKILLGCWLADADTALTADAVKADATATLRDAVRFCLDAASARRQATPIEIIEPAVPREAAA